MPAPIKLSEKQITEISAMLRRDHAHAVRERAEWKQNLATWQRMYDGVVTKKNWPWKNAANVFLTIVGDEVDDFVSRGMNTLFGDTKWAPAVPVEGHDEVRWPKVENFMQWALQSEMKAYGDFNAILHSTAVDGTCFVFPHWVRKIRTTHEIKYQPNNITILGRQLNIRPSDKVVLERTFGEQLLSQKKNKGGGYYDVKLEDDGRDVFGRVWITRNPQGRKNEIEVEIEKESIVYDAPKISVLNPTSVYTTDVGDIQDAPFVQIERKVTTDWLKRQREEGRLNLVSPEDFQRMLDHQTDLDAQESEGHSEKEAEKDEVTGVDTQTQAAGRRRNWLCFYRYDLNGDGFEEETIFEYDPALDILLRADYLGRDFPHGRRPVVVFRLLHVPNRMFGKSIPGLLYHYQLMINTLLNQAIDAGTLQNKRPWFYDKTGQLDDREKIEALTPGTGIGVMGSPRERIFIPDFGGPSESMLAFVDMLTSFSDRRVGRFDLAGGGKKKGSSSAGAVPRTFGGMNMVLMEGLSRQNYIIKLLAMGGQGATSGFNELFHQIYDLYAKMMPKKKRFRIMAGQDIGTPAEISREDLQIRPDFMFAVNMLQGNPGIRRADTMLWYQTVAPDLIKVGALQEWRAALTRLHRAFDEQNPEEVTPTLPGMLRRAPMDPEAEEWAFLVQGIPDDPLPTDDHSGHIAGHNAFKEQMIAILTPEAWEEHDQHVAKHIEMMQEQSNLAGQMAGGGSQPSTQRPMGTERRAPGQPRQQRPGMGGTFG